MNAIDIHAHLVIREHLAEEWWCGVAQRRRMQEAIGRTERPAPVTPQDVDAIVRPRADLSTPEKLIAYLDGAGVKKSVLLPLDWGHRLSKPAVSIEEQNRYYADLARRFPDRLVAFAGVDPRRERQATDLFEVGVRDWGMRGLKLHPCAGFYPNERCVYPLYEIAQARDVPVLIHCGPEFPPMASQYGQAMLLDQVALDFPKLRIIIAHLGTGTAPAVSPWVDDALWLASNHPNIFLDFGSRQIDYAASPVGFYRQLRWIMDRVPISKLLFGSDFPYMEFAATLAQWVAVFDRPDPAVLKEAGVAFTRDESEAILWRNAGAILG